jgi:GPI mannosyltransferase 3
MLGLAALFDRSFYQQWTFPPLRFLYFNIAQSLAVFYGKNDWHYYLSQGFPLLLTSYLPFAAIGLYSAYQSYRSDDMRSSGPRIRGQLAIVTVVMPLILSFISHKEVRFIYPLLPILHVLAARPAAACFEPALAPRPPPRLTTLWHYRPIIIPVLLMINVLIGIFTTQMHQLGPLTVMDFLRQEHEKHYLIQPPQRTHMIKADTTMTVGFLMPCHSTPWRSHLIYPSIKAWALGCEPPINMDPTEREAYVDEADEFYENPERFLKTHLGKPPARKTILGRKNPQDGVGTDEKQFAWDGKPGRKVWPEYLVFFEALEPTIQAVTKNSGYIECWRGWSSWVHDDRRRKGDVIVMCSHAVHPHPRPIGT